MAEKITLFEIHAHTDGSSLDLEPSLGSGVGSLVSSALGGEANEEEDDSVVDSLEASDDEGGDEEDEKDESKESESLDFDADEETEDEEDEDADGGAGKGTGIAGLLALIAFVFLARNFLGEDDEEDPFEEEFGQ